MDSTVKTIEGNFEERTIFWRGQKIFHYEPHFDDPLKYVAEVKCPDDYSPMEVLIILSSIKKYICDGKGIKSESFLDREEINGLDRLLIGPLEKKQFKGRPLLNLFQKNNSSLEVYIGMRDEWPQDLATNSFIIMHYEAGSDFFNIESCLDLSGLLGWYFRHFPPIEGIKEDNSLIESNLKEIYGGGSKHIPLEKFYALHNPSKFKI